MANQFPFLRESCARHVAIDSMNEFAGRGVALICAIPHIGEVGNEVEVSCCER